MFEILLNKGKIDSKGFQIADFRDVVDNKLKFGKHYKVIIEEILKVKE